MDKSIFDELLAAVDKQLTASEQDVTDAQQMFEDATQRFKKLKTARKELLTLNPDTAKQIEIPTSNDLDAAITTPATNGLPDKLTDEHIKARILGGLMRRGKRTAEHTTPRQLAIPGIPTHDRGRAFRILNELKGTGLVDKKSSNGSEQYWITQAGAQYYRERLAHLPRPKNAELILDHIGKSDGITPGQITMQLGIPSGSVTSFLTTELKKGDKSRVRRDAMSNYHLKELIHA